VRKSPYELLKWLDSKPRIQEVRTLAKKLGVRLKRTMKKRDIIKKLRTALKERLKVEQARSSATSVLENSGGNAVREYPKQPRLPESYNKDKLVLLPVNPNWIYAYWDFSRKTRESVQKKAGNVRFVIRLHDVTYVIFNGFNAHRSFEADVDLDWGNYYFQVPNSNADYLCQLGYIENGRFVPLLASNVVRTPPISPSDKKEEIWIKISKGKRYSKTSEGMVEKPVERAVGSSQWPNVGPVVEASGGGAFIWRMVREGRSGGTL